MLTKISYKITQAALYAVGSIVLATGVVPIIAGVEALFESHNRPASNVSSDASQTAATYHQREKTYREVTAY